VQVAITTRHGSINGPIHELINSKSSKLLTYFERVTSIDVTVDFETDRITVEILVDAEHRHNFVSRDVGDEVVSTFERALHKMEQQIKKYKQKIQDHRRDRPMNEITDGPAGEPESEAE